MAQSNPNPLLSPPFYLIPGINPSSPISAQTEQIDQLNTLLLQEIDASFARFHQIVTTKVLPEIKRFAIASEPTREAATFWKSFFEAAAAVRVPVPGEPSLLDNSSNNVEEEGYEDQTLLLSENQSFIPEDGSFIFAGATTSTPRAGQAGQADRFAPSESWEESMESPFDRLDRKLRDDLRLGGEYADSDAPTPSLPSGYELPGIGGADSTYSGDASTGTVELADLPRSRQQTGEPSRSAVSPAEGDTPKAKRNPFTVDPSSANLPGASEWNGIADLRSTPLNAKFKKPKSAAVAAAAARASKSSLANTLADLTMDEDEDDLPAGMSPPVTMNFTLPPRAQAVMNAAKTPVRSSHRAGPSAGEGGGGRGGEKEARMILDDLMEEMERGYEPSPRMPTPEGLGRYSIMPGDIPHYVPNEGHSSRNHMPPGEEEDYPGRSPLARKSMANTSYGSDIIQHASHPAQPPYPGDDDDSFADDSFDSMDDLGAHAGPGAGAGRGAGETVRVRPSEVIGDETYLTMSPGPAPGGDRGDISAMSPFAGDKSEAGMIFGPAAGAQGGALSVPGAGRGGEGEGGARGRFSLMKMDEMMTFHGGRLEDAAGREVADSPTNALGKR